MAGTKDNAGQVHDDTKLSDVLPLIESRLTVAEVAERLRISVEAARALVVAASLRSGGSGEAQ